MIIEITLCLSHAKSPKGLCYQQGLCLSRVSDRVVNVLSGHGPVLLAWAGAGAGGPLGARRRRAGRVGRGCVVGGGLVRALAVCQPGVVGGVVGCLLYTSPSPRD